MTYTKQSEKEYDAVCGHVLRAFRCAQGFSQETLGACVNITFQQVQKYERGMNRLSISRLNEFCKFLNISKSTFLEEVDSRFGADEPNNEMDVKDKSILKATRNFKRIKSRTVRNKISHLIAAIAEGE